jgi:hypothetical protein
VHRDRLISHRPAFCFIVFVAEIRYSTRYHPEQRSRALRTLTGLYNNAASKSPDWVKEGTVHICYDPSRCLRTPPRLFTASLKFHRKFCPASRWREHEIHGIETGRAPDDARAPTQRTSFDQIRKPPASTQIAKHCSTSQRPRRSSHPRRHRRHSIPFWHSAPAPCTFRSYCDLCVPIPSSRLTDHS